MYQRSLRSTAPFSTVIHVHVLQQVVKSTTVIVVNEEIWNCGKKSSDVIPLWRLAKVSYLIVHLGGRILVVMERKIPSGGSQIPDGASGPPCDGKDR